jgi:hypothetical protein
VGFASLLSIPALRSSGTDVLSCQPDGLERRGDVHWESDVYRPF